MKLTIRTPDNALGLKIDALAVATYDLILTAIARIELLDDNSLRWLRDSLRAEMAVYNTNPYINTVLQAHITLIVSTLESSSSPTTDD